MYDKASIALIPSGYKAGSTDNLYSVLPANGNGDFNATRGSTATRVNKDGLIESVATNVPRLDYPLTNGVVGDCPHLLLEPQRINKIAYSEGFNNWAAVFTSVNLNEVVSPDGSVNATKLTDTSNSSTHRIQLGNTTSSSGSFCYSIFLKKGTLTTVALSVFSGAAAADSKFDLDNGTIVSTTNGTAEIQDYGNDWYRCIVKGTLASTSTTTYVYLKEKASYSGSSQFLYAWGAMLEEGSYPTSYIKTTSGQVTRSADACNGSGTSAEFNDSEGVLFAEVEFLDNANTGYISVSDGTPDNRCIIYSAANQIVVATKSGGSGISKSATGTPTNLNKIAVAYSSSGSKFFLNGSNETGTGSFSTTPRVFAANTLDQINFDISDGSNDLYARVKQVIYFNEALSDSELQTLTS